MSDLIPLTRASAELAKLLDEGQQPPGYRRLYLAILDGKIAAQSVNGRWHFQRTDLPGIAAVFGLTIPDGPAAP